jgi:hypothetical protein
MYRAIMRYLHEVKLDLKKDIDEAADNGEESALILLKCILYRSAFNEENRKLACNQIRDHLLVRLLHSLIIIN